LAFWDVKMNFLDRINAVIHHEEPDRVPFVIYSDLAPRGSFEREMRNRGTGILVKHSTIWSEMPDVGIETRTQGNITTTFYHTPVGTVSIRKKTHIGRISNDQSVEIEGMIKDLSDYDPVIFMVENTVFHTDNAIYYNLVRDVGKDGILREEGPFYIQSPYDCTRVYFGYTTGLTEWVYEQHDHPEYFVKLLKALERRFERLFPLIVNSPAELVLVGVIDGQFGPKQFKEYVLPFYRKYIPVLHANGKICSLHAHALNLKEFKDLIPQTGVDIIEAFTPPPVGNISIKEARAAWGDQVIIWVNLPETIFWLGEQKTRQYTINLLKSDPSRNVLVIGFTEMGLYGIRDEKCEEVFKAGFKAVLNCINKYSNY